jgi:hypothetical protein
VLVRKGRNFFEIFKARKFFLARIVKNNKEKPPVKPRRNVLRDRPGAKYND